MTSIKDRKTYRDKNREHAFDLTHVENDWVHRGDSIQATFRELRKEDIRKVWSFTSAAPKPDDLKEKESDAGPAGI